MPLIFSKLIIPKLYRLTEKNWNLDGVQCDFTSGTDGAGGSETPIGFADSSYMCFRNVLEYKKNISQQDINGATWNPTSKDCYAEIGATFLSGNCSWCNNWDSCIFSGIGKTPHAGY